MTGDWNGDGRTDLGVYAAGTWSLQLTGADGSRRSESITFGQDGDLPVTGDWNGDGADDLGVWRPTTGVFTLRKAAPLSGRATEVVTQKFGRAR